jgi:predicted DNA-binding WGR domain protein
MKRNFINQEGDANKFWNVETVGSAYTVAFGKIGTKGRETTKQLDTLEACAAEVSKLIQEKLRKGYREIQAGETVPEKAVPEKLKPVYRPMDEDLFWEILSTLNWKRTGDDDAVLLPAEKRLAALPLEDIFAFDEFLAEKLYQLDEEKYAAACYPGEDLRFISGDGFLYDRCSVLTNGRAFYEAVVLDPGKWPVGFEFESLIYLPQKAYKRKTKSEDYPYLTNVSIETGSNKAGWAKSN